MPIDAIHFNQSNLNSCLSCVEGAFNLIGYAPSTLLLGKHKKEIDNLRFTFGGLMAITAAATSAISFGISLAKPEQSAFYRDFAKRAIEYVGHGVLNMARSYVERYNLGVLTLAYDIYNQKLLPYANVKPQFDIQSRLFVFIKTQADTLLPAAKNKLAEFVRSFL